MLSIEIVELLKKFEVVNRKSLSFANLINLYWQHIFSSTFSLFLEKKRQCVYSCENQYVAVTKAGRWWMVTGMVLCKAAEAWIQAQLGWGWNSARGLTYEEGSGELDFCCSWKSNWNEKWNDIYLRSQKIGKKLPIFN